MKGRDVFKFFRFIIKSCSFFIGFLPNFLIIFLYDLSSVLPGRIGVLIRYILIDSICSLGDNVYIGRHVIFKNINNIEIGSNTSIHDFCYLDAIGNIKIGNNVSIAHGSSLVSFEHGYKDVEQPIKYNKLKLSQITIDDDVWVGCSVKILSGCIIKKRTIIAAGAVVKGELDSCGIYGGIPAKRIKDI
ncbi:acyltransferase [Aliivibrio fischeri]|uniref:acyltransferase n=1 Tax=Aliivibrio fischeri TaxID=668 RepID=UPI001F32E518|nr:acyltransferase [Aliivibrio fischeri]MCE4935519.1 acyltransferase [Aliivibrio fischeri]